MVDILWTLWLPSHVHVVINDLDPVQELVRLQEIGTKERQHASKVIT